MAMAKSAGHRVTDGLRDKIVKLERRNQRLQAALEDAEATDGKRGDLALMGKLLREAFDGASSLELWHWPDDDLLGGGTLVSLVVVKADGTRKAHVRKTLKGALEAAVGVKQRCGKCKVEKDASAFTANASKEEGRSSWCRGCQKAWREGQAEEARNNGETKHKWD